MKKLILKLILVSAAVASLSASAVTIGFGNYGVGTWVPGSGFNGDADSLVGVAHLVDVWNGTQPAGLYTVGNNSSTFTKGAGLLVPLTLAAPVALGWKDETAPFSALDNSLGTYSYLLAKYGNSTYLFYVGGVLDSAISVESSLGPGLGLSHLSAFTSFSPGPTVPDAGATALMLGLGLAALAPFARKRRAC